MIRHFCDITGKEIIPNMNTKDRVDFNIKVGDKDVYMRAYFCVDNEGSGELSMEGIMLMMRALADAYFEDTDYRCTYEECPYMLDDGQCSFCPDSIPEDGLCSKE